MQGAQSERQPLDLPLADNRSWVRQDDVDAMRSRMAHSDCAPMPSRRSGQWRPVPWQDLASYLGSYNAWVRLWNIHETDWSLPTSPDWWDGEKVCSSGNILRLRFHSGLEVEVKLRRWWHFHDGWSCCRNEAPIASVVWARQRQSQPPEDRIRESAGRSR
jgi:hypothetical protein